MIRLARSWKSLLALDRISIEVFLGALSGFTSTSPTNLFIIAVGLEDPTLLGFVVSQTGQRSWVFAWSDMDCICQNWDGASRDLQSKLTHTHHYHFGCWTLEQYESIPPHIVYLLTGMIGSANEINHCTIGRKLKTKLLRARESIQSISLCAKADMTQMDLAIIGPTLSCWTVSTFPIVEGRRSESNTSTKKTVEALGPKTSHLKRHGRAKIPHQSQPISKLRSSATPRPTRTWL
jgi:hypothetical protein